MIKENINKIDYDLKNLFEDVKILEKSNKGNYYFEIDASSKNTHVKVEISKHNLNNKIIKWSYYTNPTNESSDKIERISTLDNIAYDVYDVVSTRKMDPEYLESIEFLTESVSEESKFKKAYSDPNGKFDYWDIVKDIIDEEGWVYTKEAPNMLDYYFEQNTGKSIEFQKSFGKSGDNPYWLTRGSRWRPEELSEKTLSDKTKDILEKFEITEKLFEGKKFDINGNTPEKTLIFSKKLKISDKVLLESELKSIGIDYVSFINDTVKIKI